MVWRPEQNRNNFNAWLIVGEIAVIAVVVIALASFLWEKAGVGRLDQSLQIAFAGIFALLIIFVANYIINRRW